MWWLAGIATLICAGSYIYIVRYRRSALRARLANGAYMLIRSTLIWLDDPQKHDIRATLDPGVKEDPYLLGITQGIVGYSVNVLGPDLSGDHKVAVLMEVLHRMFGDDCLIVGLQLADLKHRGNADFDRGEQNGFKVCALVAGFPTASVLADPDVQISIKQASEPGAWKAKDQWSGPARVLMQIYMKRHRHALAK